MEGENRYYSNTMDNSAHFENTGSWGRIEAPAKINLHLDVGPPREDGYHGIRSLFAMVDLKDDLCMRVLDKQEGECIVEGPFTFPSEKNLICKAYRSFAALSGWKKGVHVSVTKRIPDQGGLGGGSSNAAAALKLLQHLSGTPLNPGELHRAALETGSDVPFFLSGPVSLVESRGEILGRVDVREDVGELVVLLIFPPFGVSTADAYKNLDNRRKERGREGVRQLQREHIVSAYVHEGPEKWPFYNSFTEVLKEMYPPYIHIFNTIQAGEALFYEISGSGSTVFALFDDTNKAEKMEKRIKKDGISARKVKMLASCPEAVYNI